MWGSMSEGTCGSCLGTSSPRLQLSEVCIFHKLYLIDSSQLATTGQMMDAKLIHIVKINIIS